MTGRPVAAGRMDQRITIQARAAGQDAAGQPLTTWPDVATVWADVRHPTGMEATRAGAETSVAVASMRIRWIGGIDAGMRVLYAGAIYRITAVLPNRPRRTIDLACEVVNAET